MRSLFPFAFFIIISFVFLEACNDDSDNSNIVESYPYYYSSSHIEYSKIKMITPTEVIDDTLKIKKFISQINNRSTVERPFGDTFEFSKSRIESEHRDVIAKRISKDSIRVFTDDKIYGIKIVDGITYWENPDTSTVCYPMDSYNNHYKYENFHSSQPLYRSEPIPPFYYNGYSYCQKIKFCYYLTETSDLTCFLMSSLLYKEEIDGSYSIFFQKSNNTLYDPKYIQSKLLQGDTVVVQEYKIGLTKSTKVDIPNPEKVKLILDLSIREK